MSADSHAEDLVWRQNVLFVTTENGSYTGISTGMISSLVQICLCHAIRHQSETVLSKPAFFFLCLCVTAVSKCARVKWSKKNLS
jgi:hypothetical protein